MNNNAEQNILQDLIKQFNFDSSKNYKLIILMGLLGDFDSIEYAINLSKFIKENKFAEDLDIFTVAIGKEIGKEKFCKFTGFSKNNLRTVENNDIHKLVGATAVIDGERGDDRGKGGGGRDGSRSTCRDARGEGKARRAD